MDAREFIIIALGLLENSWWLAWIVAIVYGITTLVNFLKGIDWLNTKISSLWDKGSDAPRVQIRTRGDVQIQIGRPDEKFKERPEVDIYIMGDEK